MAPAAAGAVEGSSRSRRMRSALQTGPVEVGGVREWQPPPGQPGEGMIIETSRGDVRAILHEARSDTGRGIVWVWGVRGGFDGPADSVYRSLAEELRDEVTSLRVDYHHPTAFDECVHDALAGVAYLGERGCEIVALVGQSLGGAVVIAAAPRSPLVRAVVALSSQTLGAGNAADVSPVPLLLIHGENDRNLPVQCSRLIYEWAEEPKELVIYPGAGHGLRQCKDEVRGLLRGWLIEKLAVPDNSQGGSDA